MSSMESGRDPWERQAIKNQHDLEIACGNLAAAESRLKESESTAAAAVAKCLRLGRKLQRVGLHLKETRDRMRKVEGERDSLREKLKAAERTISRVQADRDSLLREKAGLPAEAQAALAATEAA